MKQFLPIAVAGTGLVIAAVWAVLARRGRDPLGPRPSAPFGDTTKPLLAATVVYVLAIVAFPWIVETVGFAPGDRVVAVSFLHLAFALVLLDPVRRAAPPARATGPRQALAGVLGGIATFGIAGLVGVLLQWTYDAAGVALPEQDVVQSARVAGGAAAAATILSAAVIAPFAEEVFWRGIALPAFLVVAPVRTALAAQALAFGAMHVVNSPLAMWPLALPLAVVGWLAGWIYLRTASLGAAVLLHAVFNGLNIAFLRMEA